MLAIQAGDHIGASFAASTTFAVTTASFIHQGLDAGGRVMVFAGDLTSDSTELITAGNLRLRQAARSGQLAFGDSRAVKLINGHFDPAHLYRIYSSAVVRALDAGFTGLWVSVDMSWAKPGVVDPEALIAYEAQAHPLFRDQTLTAICHYDTRIFPIETARRACSAHPASLRAATMRYRYHDGTLSLSGETDLTNRLAFETIAGALDDVETLDLLGMQFVDLRAAAILARTALASPRLRIRVNPSQHELLSVSGAPQAQLQVDLSH